jgi:hypothetical protein
MIDIAIEIAAKTTHFLSNPTNIEEYHQLKYPSIQENTSKPSKALP